MLESYVESHHSYVGTQTEVCYLMLKRIVDTVELFNEYISTEKSGSNESVRQKH